jgi:hypothetical protein
VINKDRLAEVQARRLDACSHDSPQSGLCFMEAVAYINGEPHSDRPACACPFIGSYMRHLNDSVGVVRRQELKEHLIGVAGSRVEFDIQYQRSYKIADFEVKSLLPVILLGMGCEGAAERICQWPPITSSQSAAIVAHNLYHMRGTVAGLASYALNVAASLTWGGTINLDFVGRLTGMYMDEHPDQTGVVHTFIRSLYQG